MSNRDIMWTALPNGVAAQTGRLKLSVLVSPRLTANAANGRLGEFPDFLDWPAVVSTLHFSVQIQGGPTFDVSPVTEPGYPGPDSAAWKALFNEATLVHSYQYEDLSGAAVRSFPVQSVHAFIKQQYQAVAVSCPDATPSMAQLGFDVRGGRPVAQFGAIVLNAQIEQEVNARIDALLRHSHAVPPGSTTPIVDLYQVRLMHQPLQAMVRNPDGTLQPLPPQTLPDVDFHRAVGAMGQYPKLMRALGLVIDLEFSPGGVPASGSVRVTPRLAGPPPMTPWTAFQFDAAGAGFYAAPGAGADISHGMLALAGPADYDVTQMDLDGAAEKALDFARNVARIAYHEATSTIDTPDSYGLPALRSAGFSVARAGRALRLVGTFDTMKQHNKEITANPQQSKVTMFADDVTRGYRVDVWDSLTGDWHSLCQRSGTYTFEMGPLVREFDDEGFVTLATTQSADGSSTDLRLPESLFRWAGWSLSARPPGRTISSDSTAQDVANPATTDFKLETSFVAAKGTLPRLRFGASYQFRARAVDLAGNSLPPDAVLDDAYSVPAQPVAYLRYEPVVAPVLVLRQPLGPDTTPGESLDRIVIRSNYDSHIAAVSERHVAPAKTTPQMAEAHGMLDTAAGPPDKSLYSLLVGKDGSFEIDPAHPGQPVPHPEAQLALPYLPDPLSPGAAFATLPGDNSGAVWQTPFIGTWPDNRPFRFVLDEGTGPPSFAESDTERVLTVHLAKAEIATVALSSYLTDDFASRPARMLETMAIWDLISSAEPGNLASLRQLALDGQHWMLTPPRTLTLVHAVQQPLIEPQFQNLTCTRSAGSTSATLTDEFPLSGKSTDKVDINAVWQEPVDDLTDAPQPVILPGSARALEQKIAPSHQVAVINGVQEFHDTKHRTVTYTATATTRFREYFPAALTADTANISRTSVPVTLSVPSSARPPAPQPLYVVPTFAWSTQEEGAWTFSRRKGGGLRVYLARPWYSSGEGELLGAVLWGCEPPEAGSGEVIEVPYTLKGYVTQWGIDPIWSSPPPPSQAVPRPEHFRNAVAFAEGLTLDELPGQADTSFSVAGHEVQYDQDRQLWYCDIDLDPGYAYFPFIRLALARYQPDSLPGTHLSRVVLADFVQLAPGRSASVTLDPIDLTQLQLAVSGPTYTGPGAATMTATVQAQPAGGGGNNQPWIPVAEIALQPYDLAGPDTLWVAQITLPAARGSRPFRLVIEETETFTTDINGTEQRRLVYADVFDLGTGPIPAPGPSAAEAAAVPASMAPTPGHRQPEQPRAESATTVVIPSLPGVPMPHVRVSSGANAGQAFDLHQGEQIIGRGEGSEILLEDSTVSHHHAILRVHGRRVTVEDLRSTNGTKVNGVTIERQTSLTPGDQLDVGGVTLILEQQWTADPSGP
jgi:hypothetical protein